MKAVHAKYHLVVASRFKRYMEMFKFTENIKSLDKQFVPRKIKHFIEVFKREDAIIWALRKLKAWLQYKYSGGGEEKAAHEYAELDNEIASFRYFLGEARDNNIQEILRYRFPPNASVKEVINFLNLAFRRWQASADEQKRVLTEGNETFLKLANGWEWQVVPEGFCTKEGDAMRHCGNKPSVQEGDRLLSLREPVKLKKGKGWKPHLTFILHEDDYLGEMKGYANEKPKAIFHPAIKELLLHDEIKGIRGGGYASNRNFEMTDLSKEEREALYEKKPALMTIVDKYRSFGLTDEIKLFLKNEGGIKEIVPGKKNEQDRVILVKYDNIKEFASADNESLDKALERLEDYDGLIDIHYTPSMKEIFNSLTGDAESKIVAEVMKKHGDEIETYIAEHGDDDLSESEAIIQMIDDDDLLGDVKDALLSAWETAERHSYEEQYNKELKSYVDHYRFSDDTLMLMFQKEGEWSDFMPQAWLDAEIAIVTNVVDLLVELNKDSEFHPDGLDYSSAVDFEWSGNSAGLDDNVIVDEFQNLF